MTEIRPPWNRPIPRTRGEGENTPFFKQLVKRGFDLTEWENGLSYRLKCSRCEAYVEHGFSFHVAGCPNDKDSGQVEDGIHVPVDMGISAVWAGRWVIL
jgi:hypothetical protein